MSLVLTEEQLMIKESAERLLSKNAPLSEFRKLRDSNDKMGFSKELWQEMIELGWGGMAIDEAYGGFGFGFTGLGLIQEQIGRSLCASPMISTVLTFATMIQHAGNEQQKTSILPKVAQGEIIGTLALEEGQHHAPEQTSLTGTLNNDGYVLNGKKVFVLDAHIADQIIVVARTNGQAGDENGLSLFLVDAKTPGIQVEKTPMVDSKNAGTVTLENVILSKEHLLGEQDKALPILRKVLAIVNVGIAAELLGISHEAFDRTLDYLKTRKQFGQLIGTFQGLQHRAADMYAELEVSKSIVLLALNAIENDDPLIELYASAAKAKLSVVAKNITCEAIQMHGGIGMTDECDIGFFIKRAQVAEQLFGDQYYHLNRFAQLRGY